MVDIRRDVPITSERIDTFLLLNNMCGLAAGVGGRDAMSIRNRKGREIDDQNNEYPTYLVLHGLS